MFVKVMRRRMIVAETGKVEIVSDLAALEDPLLLVQFLDFRLRLGHLDVRVGGHITSLPGHSR